MFELTPLNWKMVYMQPTLRSLGKFLFTKIKKIKLSNYKWHFLRFVNMPTKGKKKLVSICDPTMFKI